MSRKTFIAVILFGVLFVAGYHAWSRQQEPPREEEKFAPPLTLRLVLTLENVSGEFIQDSKIRVFLPQESGPFQKRFAVRSTPPGAVLADEFGNSSLEVPITVPPYGVSTLTVETEVRPRIVARADSFHPAARHTAPEPNIESDDPEITAQAIALKKARPVESARAIYDFVRGHVREAGYVRNDRGALAALRDGYGDCSEHASLFVALSRALGIPARRLGGFVVRGSANLVASDYHNWAEVFLDEMWHIIDPQKGVFLDAPNHYVTFREFQNTEGGEITEATQSFLAFDPRLRVTLGP